MMLSLYLFHVLNGKLTGMASRVPFVKWSYLLKVHLPAICDVKPLYKLFMRISSAVVNYGLINKRTNWRSMEILLQRISGMLQNWVILFPEEKRDTLLMHNKLTTRSGKRPRRSYGYRFKGWTDEQDR